jgi:TolB-like protein
LIILIPLSVVLINKVSKTAIKEKSIAVLPFKYLSDEAEKQYLADGMMDAILTGLSKIKDLRVISRTSVEQYRNTEKTTGTIGKELDVAYLLEGSFLKNGNQVRLVLQLIRTSDDSHVWTHGYNGDWNTIFGIQSEVTESVASALNTEITPEEKQLIQKMPTINPNAYDFYIRGVDEFDNYDDSISLENAQHLFQKAVELDSTFALGYSLLAGVYWSKHYWKTFLSETFLDSVLILSNLALA